jgi:hypothetical protein
VIGGLDLSITGTGLSVYQGGPLIRRLIHTEPEDGSDCRRMNAITCAIVDEFSEWRPRLVVIEGYAFDKKFGGERLAELHGLIKNRLYCLRIPWTTITPQGLKKEVLGGVPQKPKDWPLSHDKWRAHVKQMMIDEAVRLGCQTGDDNVADAFHLARYGARHYTALIEEARLHIR